MRAYVIIRIIGNLLLLEGAVILLISIWSLIGGEDCWVGLLYSALLILSAGLFFVVLTPRTKDLHTKESLLAVTLGWVVVSVLGALPYLFTGGIPGITDAIFESVSGFTTTGSSILPDIEALPRGLHFWRSSTHFLGGMGIIVFALLIIPRAGVGGMTILRSENPVLLTEQSVPQVAVWLRRLLLIYVGLIAIETVLLMLGGMPLFDSLMHAFGSVATGGFSTKNSSIGTYDSVYMETVVLIFMFAGGMNFAIYYHILRGNVVQTLKRIDFLFYLIFTVCAILVVALVNWGSVYGSALTSLRYSAFQVVSFETTTGFATTDCNVWPAFSQFMLIILMLIGASAGSTCGAIKNIRIIILYKCLLRELRKMVHPQGVFVVRVNDRPVEETELLKTAVFVATYLCFFLIFTLLLTLTGLDMISSLSGVAATLGGVGPGIGIVGTMGNFASITVTGKWLFIACMLLGRLEILTFLAIIKPRFLRTTSIKWKG